MKESHNIFFDSFGYNLHDNSLTVQFSDETKHTYKNVPIEVYRAFVKRNDKENYFLSEIMGRYELAEYSP